MHGGHRVELRRRADVSDAPPGVKLPPMDDHRPSRDTSRFVLALVSGGGVLAALAAMASISDRLTHPLPDDPPVVLFSALAIAAGAGFVGFVAAVRRLKGRGTLLLIAGVGVAMRVLMGVAPPMLEDDFYRYLLDGAMVAERLDPYATAPAELGGRPVEADIVDEAGPVVERINHPHLATIYPPVGQAAFTVAHWLMPYEIDGLRVVWLALEAVTLGAIVLMLRRLQLPLAWSAVYWCNPLAAVYVVNMAHMDVVAYGLTAAAVALAVCERPRECAAVLGLAVGAKLWPIILMPLLLRGAARSAWQAVETATIFALVAGASLLPMIVSGLHGDAGVVAYSKGWVNNEALFRLVEAGWEQLIADRRISHGTARATVGVLAAVVGVGLAVRPVRDGRDLIHRGVVVLAVMFLLSPTQFPWYFLWLLPLLAVRPRWSLVLYAVTLPLYHLQYDPGGLGDAAPWVAHLPIAALFAAELVGRGRFGVWRCVSV